MKKTGIELQKVMEELKENHNWSWANEIDYRNRDNLNNSVIFYRGISITYKEFMDKSNEMAKSLIGLGYGKSSEIPVCMSNTPEFVMLLRAISLIGAKINVFGPDFDCEYISEIINNSKSKYLFITDNFYGFVKQSLDKTNVEKVITFSLTDSLPNKEDPYYNLDSQYCDFTYKVSELKQKDPRIMNKEEFIEISNGIDLDLDNVQSTLDDDFLITYTSGSTNLTRPKAIVHTNSSLIYMGRFHDPDMSGLPSISHIRVLASIPTHSNTDLITSISDSMMENCEIALEPIYNENFFIDSLIINDPSFAPATRSFYLRMCHRYNNEPQYKNVKFKKLYIPTIVGEPNSPGEEKYINMTLKKAHAGVKMVPRPISPVVISIGGGDCEHGGLYFTLYRKYLNLLNKISGKSKDLGLIAFNELMETVCLDENGNHLPNGEYGILAANSPCTMKEYKDNPEATEKFYVTDCNGKKYANLNVFGYIDESNSIHMKGRADNVTTLSSGAIIPLFIINDCIQKDTKNILSAETVISDGCVIVHVEQYPTSKLNNKELAKSILNRIINELPCEILENLYIKIRNKGVLFPLTGCGKRSNKLLAAEGLTEDLIKGQLYQDELYLSYPFAKEDISLTRKRN